MEKQEIGEIGADRTAAYTLDKTLYDEEYQRLCNWLANNVIPADRASVRHGQDGSEIWVVHFTRSFIDIRDGREKESLSFQARGPNSNLTMGTPKAAALAHTASAYANIPELAKRISRRRKGRIRSV